MADFETQTVQQVTDILVAENFSSAREYAEYYLGLTADLETEEEIASLLASALRYEYRGDPQPVAVRIAAVIYNA